MLFKGVLSVSGICFINKTTYPVISVYKDEMILADEILNGAETKIYDIESGSVELNIKENHQKVFMYLWISLYPETEYELIIKNNVTYLKNKRTRNGKI